MFQWHVLTEDVRMNGSEQLTIRLSTNQTVDVMVDFDTWVIIDADGNEDVEAKQELSNEELREIEDAIDQYIEFGYDYDAREAVSSDLD